MTFFVYILFSNKLNKYYVGQTEDLERRLIQHNEGESAFTSSGTPWILIYSEEKSIRKDAILLETKIKKRGIGRYLKDRNLI